MRIEPLANASSADRPSTGQRTATAAAANTDRPVNHDDVSLNNAGTAGNNNAALLWALVGGVLEQLSGQPVALSHPFAAEANCYGAARPAWIAPADQALGQAGSCALRLIICGQIDATETSMSYSLDLRLFNLLQMCDGETRTGSFTLAWPNGRADTARVSFSLTATTGSSPDPGLCLSAGSPLLAEAALGAGPGNYTLAARLHPGAPPHLALPRGLRHDFDRFAASAALGDDGHRLDISA
jgi:hypothetical protein